jgi:uncharacterized protein
VATEGLMANLIVIGASARAAAFSALRAGLQPWCADLFADADLRARCPAVRVEPSGYPHEFLSWIDRDLVGPWMYTGALENWPGLVGFMVQRRPLWGNDEETLRRVRAPIYLSWVLGRAGLHGPRTLEEPGGETHRGRWLVKPRNGAGGVGIRFWDGGPLRRRERRKVYFQKFVEGMPCSAVYVAGHGEVRLLGVTRQLIGEPWLHAAAFHYCGSLGPLDLAAPWRQTFERLGYAVARGCGLWGLFGIDCVLCDSVPWPVEVNPRYTASVEVLEYATHVPALALHRCVFESAASPPPLPARPVPPAVVGKAILFAREALVFPADGPWLSELRRPSPLDTAPAFADISLAGEPIRKGRPVLTFFARAASLTACEEELRRIAADLDRWLFRA